MKSLSKFFPFPPRGPKLIGCLILLWVSCSLDLFAQDYLVLQAKRPIVEREGGGFYFVEVTDEREKKSAELGKVLAGTVHQSIRFEKGVEKALSTYLGADLQKLEGLHAIFVRLMDLEIREKETRAGQVEGQVDLHLAFDVGQEDVFSHLVDYQGGVSYKRSAHRTDLIESALESALMAAARYFDEWMGREANRNIKLVQQIHLDIVDYPVEESGDTVFYSSNRPLVWDDFKDKPRMGSPFAATIFPSFALEGDSRIADGKVKVQMDLKVYMLKDASWVAADAKDPYTLNHEQRHFDLVKIVAERLRAKLMAMELDPDDYDSVVNYHYLEAYREMNRLQAVYDEETAHGRNKSAQARWNKLIDEVIEGEDYYRMDVYLPLNVETSHH